MAESVSTANSLPMTDAAWTTCLDASSRRSRRVVMTAESVSGTAMSSRSRVERQWSPSGTTTPESSSERITSSTKKGLPSAFARISARTLSDNPSMRRRFSMSSREPASSSGSRRTVV